jgi:hypothetical protein
MICTELDKFVRELHEGTPSWIAGLNTGQTVFMDDGRPGLTHSAWVRLGEHCQNTGDYIVNFAVQFRSNRQHILPNDADGYYFSKGARGGFALPKTHQLFFVGTLVNQKLLVTCWKVPEMLQEYTEERDPSQAGICLIKRNILPSLELPV